MVLFSLCFYFFLCAKDVNKFNEIYIVIIKLLGLKKLAIKKKKEEKNK